MAPRYEIMDAHEASVEVLWAEQELNGDRLATPALLLTENDTVVLKGSREELLKLLDDARRAVVTLPNPDNVEEFVKAYITAALWSSTDNADESGGEPLDANYGADDLHEDALATMRGDCVDFMKAQRELLAHVMTRYPEYEFGQAGHDFWLTRNGHGAGFWDRGLGDPGERLSEAARVYGTQDIYVGDDGKLYV